MSDYEKISIYRYEYENLKHRTEKLKALEEAGVSNWEYYDYAIRNWKYIDDHRKAIDNAIQNVNDLLTEAEVDQPAGYGCGYSITFDETEMAKYFKAYVARYLEIENAKPQN